LGAGRVGCKGKQGQDRQNGPRWESAGHISVCGISHFDFVQACSERQQLSMLTKWLATFQFAAEMEARQESRTLLTEPAVDAAP
jgi:hypothetical protein